MTRSPRRAPLSFAQVEQLAARHGVADTFTFLSCRTQLVELAVDGDRHAIRPHAYPGRHDLYVRPDGTLRARNPALDPPRP